MYDRPYVYGRKGRSALTCAWRQSLLAEHATYMGQTAASSLLDIAKAFDSVDHEWLQAQAKKHHFHLGILRFLLALYTMPRILVVKGVAAKHGIGARATRSIVPGESNADVLMMLSLLTPVDNAVKMYPSVHVGMLADDLQMLAIEKGRQACAKVLADVTKYVVDQLEGACKLEVSTGYRRQL